jgi:hypothetical protein
VLGEKGIFRNNFGDGEGWTSVYSEADVKTLSKIVTFLNPKNEDRREAGSIAGTWHRSSWRELSQSQRLRLLGNINPANAVIELATECHEAASATISAVSIVSDLGDGKLLSFLLPTGLTPGQYFVSISDSEEGDANFESSNCSAANVAK